jgi:hypothetical protein
MTIPMERPITKAITTRDMSTYMIHQRCFGTRNDSSLLCRDGLMRLDRAESDAVSSSDTLFISNLSSASIGIDASLSTCIGWHNILRLKNHTAMK